MFVAICVIATSFSTIHSLENFPKCCEDGSVLKNIVPKKFSCTATTERSRIEIVALSPNYNNSNDEIINYCVDVIENKSNINLYEISENGTFVQEKKAEADFFPKCCPLGYSYNTLTHSCDKLNQSDYFFNEKFVKIGLEKCSIIIDYKLNSSAEFQRNRNSIYLINQNVKYENGFFCLDKNELDRYSVRVCQDNLDICDNFKCIHKCCPDGQSFVNGSHCKNTFTHGLNLGFTERIHNASAPFAVIHGYHCRIYSLSESKHKFYINAKGTFHMYENPTKLIWREYEYDVKEETYCIEHAKKGNLDKFLLFRCFPENTIHVKFIITRWVMVVSCIFLLFTILYYVTSNEKRNLFGKTLISYCSTTFVAFLLLSYLAFNLKSSSETCQRLGFLLLYASLSSFTWLNIMCIDIYWTFGSSKSFSCVQQKNKEWKRYFWFALYGWGFPIILTLIPVFFYHIDILPPFLKVAIGVEKCYIQTSPGNYARLLFSTVPLAILQLCNVVLFIKTIIYCMKVKGEISKMNDTQVLKGEKRNNFNKYKDRLNLLFKLFIIMGIPFLFEVVSSFYDFKNNNNMAYIEIVWDTINSLQGFFVFLVFICKKKVFDRCQKKIGVSKIRKFSFNSAVTTQSNVSVSAQNNLNKKFNHP